MKKVKKKPWLVRKSGWAAVGLSAVYWIVESIVDSFLHGLGPPVSRLLSPDLDETIMRLLSMSLLIGFGFYAQTTIDRLTRTEARLIRMNESFVQFGPDPTENIKRLTELTGELLNASAVFYNQWDRGTLQLQAHWSPLRALDSPENPEGHICSAVMEGETEAPLLIRNLGVTTYAEKDPWIRAYGFQTHFGRAVSLGSETVGSLCVFYDRDVRPDDEDKRLLGIIASAIGVEEVRRRAQKRIEDAERQVRLLSAQLMSAQETERKRIAMQLHDSIGQALSAVKFSIEESVERLRPSVSLDTLRPLESAVSLIREVMRELRAMLKTLRPAMLDDLGILATINWLCREMETIYSGITVERRTDLEEEEIPAVLKVPMFRILQEALNNAVKHSHCDRIRVELGRSGDQIRLEIRDNGRGFSTSPANQERGGRTGMGLAGMRERAELSGGFFHIDSTPGEGTCISVTWPGAA